MNEELTDQLDRFDRAVDAALEPHRGRPGLETTARVLSNLGDYGFVWSLVSVAKGRRRGPRRRRAARALAVSGTVSAAVNAALKRAVARQRPAAGPDEAPGGLWVRPPSSSSFPSGHTLAAFCTAVVLADTPVEAAVYLGFAAAVGTSRVYLRAHHASDVLAGATVGLAVGGLVRPLVRTPAPRRR